MNNVRTIGLPCTVQITFIFIDFAFAILRLGLKRKTHPAFRVLNAFYFQTDFNLRLRRKRDVRLTCKRVWCILHRTLSLKWLCPLHRTLSLKWIWPAVSETLVLNETKPTQRSQITDQNLRKEANTKCAVSVHAKRVSKHVWVFRNTGANVVAKNQTHLAYEDKRDLYCMR